jgi:hypothetical protein
MEQVTIVLLTILSEAAMVPNTQHKGFEFLNLTYGIPTILKGQQCK